MGEVIACANQKGGVGKTTTVVSLASYLAMAGMQVLVVDLDPQSNATSGFGVDRERLQGSSYDLLSAGGRVSELAIRTGVLGVSLIPAERDLAGVEIELVPLRDREQRLVQALRPDAESYDYVLLDCPPSLGLLTVNALTAADSVLIPIQCEFYALEGLTQLMSTIDLVRDGLNPRLTIKGVVMTMFDGRTTLSTDVANEVRRHLGDLVFDVIVPRSVRLAEAPGYGRPISLYSPESRGAHAYRALANEVLERGGRSGQAMTQASVSAAVR
ncbi:MAG: AAA family ATPase [Candidatus Limnocylindrales bacterium]